MSKAVLHVVPHEQAWAVKREGNERASSTHNTQKDAIEAARELAKESDDIVVHRADGTIRERVTYTGSTGTSSAAPAEAVPPRPKDLASVGTRVRWSAVLAGAVVGLSLYALLSLLTLAAGLSTVDHMSGRSFAVTAAVVSAVVLLASVFIGGFVASKATVGEQPSEAMVYGVLVWGTMLLVMLGGGLGLGFGAYAGLRPGAASAPAGAADPDRLTRELSLTDRQAERYAGMAGQDRVAPAQVSPEAVAWWTFAGAALSLVAAIAGGLVGAGPEMVFKDLRDRRDARILVPQA
ncbi:MAG TPA: DUF2188 domain-containing protein [Gemmata sp.]